MVLKQMPLLWLFRLLMKKSLFIFAIIVLLLKPFTKLYAEDVLNEQIKRMTIEQKIGQLLFIGFQGKTISSEDIAHLKNINPGGIVFYARNFNDATDVAPFISKIKSIFKNQFVPGSRCANRHITFTNDGKKL